MKKTAIILGLALAASFSSSFAGAKENWTEHCAKCHGEDGKGDTKMGKKSKVKDMTAAEYQSALKDDQAFKAVKEGMKEGDSVKMKPFDKLSDDEIKALIAHVRTFK